jgi:hypothetical protein
LIYQWTLDGTILINGPRISGATSDALTISNIQPSDAGTYSLAVGDGCVIGYRITNQVLNLTVTQPPSRIAIVSQPQTQTATNGASVTFTVSATNSTGVPMTYSWYSVINGVTNLVRADLASSLSTSSYAAALAGSYFCVISNPFDVQTSSVADLWLVSDPLVYFGMEVSGPVGGRCLLAYTTNLTEPVSWYPLTNTTTTLTRSPQVIVDQESITNQTRRFYRVIFLP